MHSAPLLNGSDECVIQDESANFNADSFDDLMHRCPLKLLSEKIGMKAGFTYWNGMADGWDSCIDEIVREGKDI